MGWKVLKTHTLLFIFWRRVVCLTIFSSISICSNRWYLRDQGWEKYVLPPPRLKHACPRQFSTHRSHWLLTLDWSYDARRWSEFLSRPGRKLPLTTAIIPLGSSARMLLSSITILHIGSNQLPVKSIITGSWNVDFSPMFKLYRFSLSSGRVAFLSRCISPRELRRKSFAFI